MLNTKGVFYLCFINFSSLKNKNNEKHITPILLFLLSKISFTQTYAEKLGYPKGAKVVILHVDDVGMSYDSNLGAIKATEEGVATSMSVMMPSLAIFAVVTCWRCFLLT